MKNKLFKSIGLAVLLLTLLVSNVFAFSFSTSDGVWGIIDSTTDYATGADCQRYGRIVPETFTPIDTLGIINNVSVGPGLVSENYLRNSDVCQGDPDGDMSFHSNSVIGWTRSTPTGTARWAGIGTPSSSCTSAPALFVSEYVYQERDDDPDRIAIEIYNGTGGTVDFATDKYSLLLFTSDRQYQEVHLDPTKTVTAGDVYVVTSDSVGNQQTGHRDQTFPNDYGSYRTVVLVKNFVPAGPYTYGDENAISSIYNLSATDENQVRYGQPSSANSCPAADGTQTSMFALQSGFGFDGQVDSVFVPEVGDLFPVGRFCHYNNPISGSLSNHLNTVPLTVKINGLACPDNQELITIDGTNNLSFGFLATLHETPNSGTGTFYCAYGPERDGFNESPAWPGGLGTPNETNDTGPNRNGCADMVEFSAPNSDQSFKCIIQSDPDYVDEEYYLSLMGLTPTTVGGVCPDQPVGNVSFNQVYTAEQSNNCFCMYAAYTENQITPVTLASFGANWTEKGVLIDWETVTETNNFGFNIMRAEIVDGERIQINPEMIFSNLAPGDAFGSSYEYLDETAVPGTEYFYWLVDVPLDGSEAGIYGPISPAP